jgi:hypothetical protein
MFDTKNLTGMTKRDCAKACNADRCVVSGRAHCFHPMMSGMGAADKNPDVQAAYASACQLLGVKTEILS